MSILTDLLHNVLSSFADAAASAGTDRWAVAVIVLTVLIRALLIPVDILTVRLNMRMSRVRPKVEGIDAGYDLSDERKAVDPDGYTADRQERMRRVRDAYRDVGVNPLVVAVPLVVQSPVLLVLFATLRSDRYPDLASGSLFGMAPDGLGAAVTANLPAALPLLAVFVVTVGWGLVRAWRAKGKVPWVPVVLTGVFLASVGVLPTGALLAIVVSSLFQRVVRWATRRAETDTAADDGPAPSVPTADAR